MQNTNEDYIKELAYRLWESEGRPHGKEHEHWQAANKIASGESDEDLLKPLGPFELQEPEEPDERSSH